MRLDAPTLARYLRQRVELGEDELVLAELTGAGALAHVGRLAASPSRPADSRPGRAPGGGLAMLADEAARCTRCRLHEGRRSVVFGEGDPNADVVVVGEAPGMEEDRTGRPFVGPAGRLLDLLLASVGLPRERVYICNVLKCRPPKNRDPLPDEVAACAGFLRGQLSSVSPRALLAVGRFAAQSVTGSDRALGALRGRVHAWEGIPVIVSYHPAYLLRQPSRIRAAWEDLQLVRAVIDDA